MATFLSAEDLKKKYAGQFTGTSAPVAPPKETIGGDISSAFKGGVDYIKQGYQDAKSTNLNPIKKTEAGAKMIAGGIQAAFSPLAPVTKYIGKGIEKAGDKISESKFVQEAAGREVYNPDGTKSYQPTNTKTLERVTEDVANTATGLEVIAGGSRGTPKAPKAPKATAPIVKAPEHPKGEGPMGYVKSTVRDIVPTGQAYINEQAAKALDLTPGDMDKIYESTGNKPGNWLAENNLFGKNKEETQANIQKVFDRDYTGVRAEIAKVDKVYQQYNIPGFVTALKQALKETQGIAGLEKDSVQIQNLLRKKDLTLEDVQLAKEIIDENFDDLYNQMGEVGSGKRKRGLANIRTDIKEFIEKEVKEATGADIAKMNNNVQTSRSINKIITKRDPVGLKRSNLRMGDFAVLGMGSFIGGLPTGLALLFVKKVLETPTARLRIARTIDKVSDARKAQMKEEMKQGVIPVEFAPFIKQKDLVGRATRQAIPAMTSQSQSEQTPPSESF